MIVADKEMGRSTVAALTCVVMYITIYKNISKKFVGPSPSARPNMSVASSPFAKDSDGDAEVRI